MSAQSQFARKYGKWGLITGASAGIGEEFARQIAQQGLNVILVARRRQKLEALGQELSQQYQVQYRVVEADLSKSDFMDSIIDATHDIEVGLLVNNAGVYFPGEFLESPLDNQLTMLELNARATLILTHIFGKQMVERGRGGIINVSSMVSGYGAPYNVNYSATKSYDHYLSEGLAYELQGSGVDVQAFLPGGTWTEGAHRMMTEPNIMIRRMMMQPAPIVQLSLRKLGKQTMVVPGAMNRFMIFLANRLLPRRMAYAMWARMMLMMTPQARPVSKHKQVTT